VRKDQRQVGKDGARVLVEGRNAVVDFKGKACSNAIFQYLVFYQPVTQVDRENSRRWVNPAAWSQM
jgi:hypothetical protein